MAGNLYVRQFQRLASDTGGHSVDAGMEPAMPDQVIAFTGTSDSITLDAKAYFVELHADNVCHYVFGPTATTSNMRLPADGTVFKGLRHVEGQTLTLSAIEGT